ncbi:glutaredoxin family protein [Mesobacillus foraminis]|uniref:Glutaredoxin n=1 Tax=Mesobacillus foraminis TaxID=279826 RepID=A0A4R2BIC0_9BACI|nr:glutaredoxin family protein [Mesobacillus foraminis]TCN26821.1 glutaredoxin [Mesobacillus foraminis]
MKKTVTLYMRQRCHLCEEAKELLEELQRNWQFDLLEVDIDKDDDLTERYGITIPVVVLDGEEIQAGIININFIIEAFSVKNVDFIG